MNVDSPESLDAKDCSTGVSVDDHADDIDPQLEPSLTCNNVAAPSTSQAVEATPENGEAQSVAKDAKDAECQIDTLPTEVLAEIFVRLELKERCKASEVCRRWYAILTDGSLPLDDVVVINLFERGIWKGHVSDNAGARIRCVALKHSDGLSYILRHVRVTNSVKIWFKHAEFAKNMLDQLVQHNVRLKCLDIYPYAKAAPLSLVQQYLPELTAMTMRPHATEFFWAGLDVPYFPDFKKLDTLLLDSINLGPNACLPLSLTTLEWSNRAERKFFELRPKLSHLVNLEYLLLGHVDFEPEGQFQLFLNEINVGNLPRLQYLVFRFCKFAKEGGVATAVDSLEDATKKTPPLASLKVLKLDLCYGSLSRTVHQFLDATGPQLKIVSLNQICEDLPLLDLYQLITPLHRRNLSLHLGLLQKSAPSKKKRREELLPVPPNLFRTVLWKLEASFLDDEELLEALLSAGVYSFANEFKFVQCSGLSDQLLARISKACPRLHKLAVINCERTTDVGIRSFVSDFGIRTCSSLQVVWKRSRDHPATFFLDLVNEHRALLDGLRSRFISKKFPNDSDGERIVIWNKERKKVLFIQDYSSSEQHRILGFAIPFESADSDLDYTSLPRLNDSEDDKRPALPPPPTPHEENIAAQSVLEAGLNTN